MNAHTPFTARLHALQALVAECAVKALPAGGAIHYAAAAHICAELAQRMPDMARRAALGEMPGVSPIPIQRCLKLLPDIQSKIVTIALSPEMGGAERRDTAAWIKTAIDVALAILGDAPPGFRPFDINDLSRPPIDAVDRRIAEAEAEAEEAAQPEVIPLSVESPRKRRRFAPFNKPALS